MVQELTDVIYKHKLSWKTTSLECLRTSAVVPAVDDISVKVCEHSQITFKMVDEMAVLGTVLDAKGSTSRSLEHRLLKAEANFWSNSAAFLGPGGIPSKLKA